jgi:hypothetical protein
MSKLIMTPIFWIAMFYPTSLKQRQPPRPIHLCLIFRSFLQTTMFLEEKTVAMGCSPKSSESSPAAPQKREKSDSGLGLQWLP